MKIIVGLGNPDKKYELTRHNAGFIVLDELLGEVDWEYNKKFNALIFQDGNRLFVKPQTYMNLSGLTVGKILNFYNLIPKKLGFMKKKEHDLKEKLTVIHDDLDINLGNYKTSYNSSSAGHKGINSIIENIKTQKFTRVRIGLNLPDRKMIPTEKFVLQKFTPEELEKIKHLAQNLEI